MFAIDLTPTAKAEPATASKVLDPDTAAYELLYNEAIQALDHQRESLDELRSRAGVLLSAGVLVASFLGPSAVGPKFSWAGVLATGAFISAGALLIVLLRTKNRWRWGVDLNTILATYIEGDPPASLVEIQRSRAYYIAQDLQQNQEKLDRLRDYFDLAAVLVGAEVVLWLTAIAQNATR